MHWTGPPPLPIQWGPQTSVSPGNCSQILLFPRTLASHLPPPFPLFLQLIRIKATPFDAWMPSSASCSPSPSNSQA